MAAAAAMSLLRQEVPFLVRLRREGKPPATGAGTSAIVPLQRWWRGNMQTMLLVAGASALTAMLLSSFVAGLVAALVSGGAAVARRRAVADRAADARRRMIAELCACLSAELRAGRTPAQALAMAAEFCGADDLVRPALTTLRLGGDVAESLRSAAAQPGAAALRRVAACWTVAAESGAGLAAALERLTESLRTEESIRREIGAQVAGPRITGRMLAALPALPLAMASAVGGRPLYVLLHTPWGNVCLVVGLAFIAAGLLWSESLVRSAERRI